MYDKLTTFERNKDSFNFVNSNCNLTIIHFPLLRSETPTSTRNYTEETQFLNKNSTSGFKMKACMRPQYNYFDTPFDAEIEIVTAEFEMESTDM
jgi:hypothetical protein